MNPIISYIFLPYLRYIICKIVTRQECSFFIRIKSHQLLIVECHFYLRSILFKVHVRVIIFKCVQKKYEVSSSFNQFDVHDWLCRGTVWFFPKYVFYVEKKKYLYFYCTPRCCLYLIYICIRKQCRNCNSLLVLLLN